MNKTSDKPLDNSSLRLVDIFFYGLHMDAASLKEKGIAIRHPRLATIEHCRVVVREKAMLLREKDALAYGMLYQLTHAEIDQLYTHQPSYRAEAFMVNDGEKLVSAISMVHIEPPLDGPVDTTYAGRLREVLGGLGFPVDHIP